MKKIERRVKKLLWNILMWGAIVTVVLFGIALIWTVLK